MRLFRRRKPLHEQLAEAGELSFGSAAPAPAGLSSEPPGWDGEPRGEPGIHGVPRPRRWDAVATADAPGLRGEIVHFVALPDGTLVVEEDEPDRCADAARRRGRGEPRRALPGGGRATRPGRLGGRRLAHHGRLGARPRR